MKFWKVTVFNTVTNREELFEVAGPASYGARRVRGILQEVHPEYQDIHLRRRKKPSGWAIFEDKK